MKDYLNLILQNITTVLFIMLSKFQDCILISVTEISYSVFTIMYFLIFIAVACLVATLNLKQKVPVDFGKQEFPLKKEYLEKISEILDLDSENIEFIFDLTTGDPERIFKKEQEGAFISAMSFGEAKFNPDRIATIADLIRAKKRHVFKLATEWVSASRYVKHGWDYIRQLSARFKLPPFFIEILTCSKSSASLLPSQTFNSKEFNKMICRFLKNSLEGIEKNINYKYWTREIDQHPFEMVDENNPHLPRSLFDSPFKNIHRIAHFSSIILSVIKVIIKGTTEELKSLGIFDKGAYILDNLLDFNRSSTIFTLFAFIKQCGTYIRFSAKNPNQPLREIKNKRIQPSEQSKIADKVHPHNHTTL